MPCTFHIVCKCHTHATKFACAMHVASREGVPFTCLSYTEQLLLFYHMFTSPYELLLSRSYVSHITPNCPNLATSAQYIVLFQMSPLIL